ncbi:MAG: NADH-quinone oxidoreductase subunit J, partial [Gammaproteobacteria bacterium]
GFMRYLPGGALVAVLILLQMAFVVGPEHFGLGKVAEPVKHAAGYSNTEELGELLYTTYVYPFEIAAAILLVAIVAAITLTMRRRPQTKYQNPADQVLVKRDDRVRIVKMDAEKKR